MQEIVKYLIKSDVSVNCKYIFFKNGKSCERVALWNFDRCCMTLYRMLARCCSPMKQWQLNFAKAFFETEVLPE